RGAEGGEEKSAGGRAWYGGKETPGRRPPKKKKEKRGKKKTARARPPTGGGFLPPPAVSPPLPYWTPCGVLLACQLRGHAEQILLPGNPARQRGPGAGRADRLGLCRGGGRLNWCARLQPNPRPH